MFGAFETLHASSVPGAASSAALRLLLAVFAVVTYLAVASLRTDLVLAVILWLIFLGLVLLSIGAGTSNVNVTHAGGWVVLVFAGLAWYHAAGDIIESTFGRKVLPQPRQHRSGELRRLGQPALVEWVGLVQHRERGRRQPGDPGVQVPLRR
jgi:succinate-acetate transporter protein